jgi:hypothetical protein
MAKSAWRGEWVGLTFQKVSREHLLRYGPIKVSIMKDAVREVIKELLIPELNEIKANGHRLEGRVDEISSRIGDTNLQLVEMEERKANRQRLKANKY